MHCRAAVAPRPYRRQGISESAVNLREASGSSVVIGLFAPGYPLSVWRIRHPVRKIYCISVLLRDTRTFVTSAAVGEVGEFRANPQGLPPPPYAQISRLIWAILICYFNYPLHPLRNRQADTMGPRPRASRPDLAVLMLFQ